MHVVLQEIENDKLLDDGWMGSTRTLYYREILARFGHHSMVINLGEENKNTVEQRRTHIDYLTKMDPYNHPIALHTFFENMYGEAGLDIASVQVYSPKNAGNWIQKYIANSLNSGRQWVVMMDENGHYSKGAPPDSVDPDQDDMRTQVLWPTLMAGGGGFEWYFGYSLAHNDLNAEDWRSRDRLWELSARAVQFMQSLPFQSMNPCGKQLQGAGNSAMCFGSVAEATYALYFSATSGNFVPKLDLRQFGKQRKFIVQWFDPSGSSTAFLQGVEINGGGWKDVGNPPNKGADWVALIQEKGNGITAMAVSHKVGQSQAAAMNERATEQQPQSSNPSIGVAAAGGSLVICMLIVGAAVFQQRAVRHQQLEQARLGESKQEPEWDDALC